MSNMDWSKLEVDLIVADYLAILRSELFSEPVNKADHRRALSPQLDERPIGSIEFKHQE